MRIKHFMFLFIVVLLAGCGLADFEMPTWDINMSDLPLMNETFMAEDLIDEAKRSGNITSDSDSLMVGFIEDSIDEVIKDIKLNLATDTGQIPLVNGLDINNQIIELQITNDVDFRFFSGKISSGQLEIHFDEATIPNGFEHTYDSIDITIGEFKNDDGTQIVKTLIPNDFVNGVYVWNLSGVNIVDQDSEAGSINLNLSVNINSDILVATPVGQIRFMMSNSNPLDFENCYCYMNVVKAENIVSDIDVNYPSNLEDATQFNSVRATFKVYNSLGFDLVLNGVVKAFKDGELVHSVALSRIDDFEINASETLGDYLMTEIVVVDNTALDSLVQFMPDTMKLEDVEYACSVPDTQQYGFASNTKGIYCDFYVEVPFNFNTMHQDPETGEVLWVYPSNEVSTEISEDNQEMIDDYVNNGSVTLNISNTMKIGGEIQIVLSSDEIPENNEDIYTGREYSSTTKCIISEHLEPSVAGKPGQTVIERRIGNDYENGDISLELLKSPKLNSRVRISFNDAENVTIYKYDKIEVNGLISASIHISEDAINGDED